MKRIQHVKFVKTQQFLKTNHQNVNHGVWQIVEPLFPHKPIRGGHDTAQRATSNITN